MCDRLVRIKDLFARQSDSDAPRDSWGLDERLLMPFSLGPLLVLCLCVCAARSFLNSWMQSDNTCFLPVVEKLLVRVGASIVNVVL